MNTKKVLIDCDNTMGLPEWEVDDGLVILYLLGCRDIDILGITNTFGNGSLKDVEFYTKALLKDIGRTDIPRYSGEAFDNQNPTLLLDIRETGRYAGEVAAPDFPSDAARFLAEQVDAHPGEISILALGPVGNLHDAWKLDPDFYRKAKEIVIMGGYTRELILNNASCRELNLSCNPEAAYRMFHAECPVVVFNGHICLQAPFVQEDMNRLDMWPEERRQIIQDWLDRFTDHFGEKHFYLWDLLPAVYVSHPELFDLKDVDIAPTVDSLKFGMLQPVSQGQHAEGTPVTGIVMPDNILDRDRFMDILEEAWRCEWSLESAGWDAPATD